MEFIIDIPHISNFDLHMEEINREKHGTRNFKFGKELLMVRMMDVIVSGYTFVQTVMVRRFFDRHPLFEHVYIGNYIKLLTRLAYQYAFTPKKTKESLTRALASTLTPYFKSNQDKNEIYDMLVSEISNDNRFDVLTDVNSGKSLYFNIGSDNFYNEIVNRVYSKIYPEITQIMLIFDIIYSLFRFFVKDVDNRLNAIKYAQNRKSSLLIDKLILTGFFESREDSSYFEQIINDKQLIDFILNQNPVMTTFQEYKGKHLTPQEFINATNTLYESARSYTRGMFKNISASHNFIRLMRDKWEKPEYGQMSYLDNKIYELFIQDDKLIEKVTPEIFVNLSNGFRVFIKEYFV